MSKESVNHIDRKCIFRENFQDEASVRRNGGVPTGVVFENGVGKFNANSYIRYSCTFKSSINNYSIRFKIKPLANANWGILYSGKDQWVSVVPNSLSISTNGDLCPVYINGTLSSSLIPNSWNDVIITGYLLDINTAISMLFFNNPAAPTYGFIGDIELLEIYNYTLSADEVKNLYNNKTYKAPVLDHAEQLGPELVVNGDFSNDITGWVFEDATNYSINANGITVNRNGNSSTLSQTPLGIISGHRYKIKITILPTSGTVVFWYNGTAVFLTFDGVHEYIFIASAGNQEIRIWSLTVTGTIIFGSISLKEHFVYETKTILDVSARSGAITNRLSGESCKELIDQDNWYKVSYWDVSFGEGWSTINNILIANNSNGLLVKSFTLKTSSIYEYKIVAEINSGYLCTEQGYVNIASGINTILVTPITNGVLIFQAINLTGSILSISIREVIPSVICTDVAVVKEGSTNVMKFKENTKKINTGSYDSILGDRSIIAWFNMYEKGVNQAGWIVSNGKFELLLYENIDCIQFSSNGIVTHIETPYFISVTGTHKWRQVIVVRKSSGLASIYLDGVLSGDADRNSGTPVAGNTDLFIGNTLAANRGLEGTLSDIRIVDGLLTSEEIQQLYSSEKHLYNL